MIWTYRSERELVEAGYMLRGPAPCPVCGKTVEMWFRSGEIPVFLDPETLWPHAELRHADPPPDEPIDGKTAGAGSDK